MPALKNMCVAEFSLIGQLEGAFATCLDPLSYLDARIHKCTSAYTHTHIGCLNVAAIEPRY